MASRHHVLITGTGRAGTSFLIQLLTNLGLDTGFTPDGLHLDPIANAGLEYDVRAAGAPYVVKNPWLCDYIEDVLTDSSIHIDHVIIPVRNFDAAAASRARVQEINTGCKDGGAGVAGGLWHTEKAADQAAVLRGRFTALIEALVKFDIDITFLWYPRLTEDADYLLSKLRHALPMPDDDTFHSIFQATVRRDWVHQFGEADRAPR